MLMIIVIGSRALSLRGLDIPYNDIDIITNIPTWFSLSKKDNIKSGVGGFGKVKAKINDKTLEVGFLGTYKSDQWLVDNIDAQWLHTYCDQLKEIVYVPPIELLFLMKKSHVHCDSVHFEKTIKDYHFLKNKFGSGNESYTPFFEMRKDEAEKRYKHRTPSLMVSNDEFFNRSKETVGYVFVHDTIHEAVKHFDVPVYEMIKKDFSKAACEADMFENLPHDYKIKCVQEEAYVIGLERYLLQEVGVSPFDAYKMAVRRICTTLCSGFFRQFAIDNYFEIIDSYDVDFLKRFEIGYNQGIIKKMEGIDDCLVEKIMLNYIENVN